MSNNFIIFLFILTIVIAIYFHVKINFSTEDYPPSSPEQILKTKNILLEALYDIAPSDGKYYPFDATFIQSLGLNPRQFKEIMLHLAEVEGRCLIHEDDKKYLRDDYLRRGKRTDMRFALSHKGYFEILNSKLPSNSIINNIQIGTVETLLVQEDTTDELIRTKLDLIQKEIFEIKNLQRDKLSTESLNFIESLRVGIITNTLYDTLKNILQNGGYLS